MAKLKVIHPNFRVGEPRKRPDRPRKRAVTLVLTEAYDVLMGLAGGEEAALPRLLLESVGTAHNLPVGELTDLLPKS